MNAKVRNFLQKKNGFFIDFFYIRSQRSVVSSQKSKLFCIFAAQTKQQHH